MGLDQWTPLMWASRSDNRVNVELPLSEQADIWARTLSFDSEMVSHPQSWHASMAMIWIGVASNLNLSSAQDSTKMVWTRYGTITFTSLEPATTNKIYVTAASW